MERENLSSVEPGGPPARHGKGRDARSIRVGRLCELWRDRWRDLQVSSSKTPKLHHTNARIRERAMTTPILKGRSTDDNGTIPTAKRSCTDPPDRGSPRTGSPHAWAGA